MDPAADITALSKFAALIR